MSNYSQSNQKYSEILQNLEFDLAQTLNLPIFSEAIDLIDKANRILICGSGSSFPAASFLAKYLTLQQQKSAIFCGMGELLDEQTNFGQSDLVIMVSQGWGRGEAYLLTQKLIKLGIKMVIITGHAERKESHYSNASNLFPIEISPQNEKIFCRPNSPLTSFLKVCQLCQITLNSDKINQIHGQIQTQNWKEITTKILKSSKVVILSSALAMPSCQNLALALREGSGVAAEVFEIETYGHGWYVNDQAEPSILYLLVSHGDYSHSLIAKSRIENLVKNGNCQYLELETNFDAIYGNIWTLIWTAFLVHNLNKETTFDMNKPQGMESNRGFHEVAEIVQNPLHLTLKKIETKLEKIDPKNPKQRLIIAIAGGSATGKTSQISAILNNYLNQNGYSSQILSQDNWQLGREFVDQFENLDPGILSDQQKKLQNEIKWYKWDHPQNFDLINCQKSLEQILDGASRIEIPYFDLIKAKRSGVQIFEPTQITILEGLYSFSDQLSDFPFFYKIYGQNPLWARLLKRYFRFVYQLNIPKPQKALQQILGTVLQAHQDFVKIQAENSDEIVNLDYTFAKTIEILKLQEKMVEKGQNWQIDFSCEFEKALGKIEIWQDLATLENYFVVIYQEKFWEFVPIEKATSDLLKTDLSQT